MNKNCQFTKMNLEPSKASSQDQIESESEHSQPYAQTVNSCSLTAQKTSELFSSYLLLQEFVREGGEETCSQIVASVKNYCGRENYLLIQSGLALTTAKLRIHKMVRNKQIKKNWGLNDIKLLVWVISQYMLKNGITNVETLDNSDWKRISALIPGTSSSRCKFKWLSLKQFKLDHYQWQKNQSQILLKLVKQNGLNKWKILSEGLYQLNPDSQKVYRTPKQCREHWNSHLNPSIHRGPWTDKEDRNLLESVLMLGGSKKWSQICKYVKGRTQNSLKNRFNLLIQKQRTISKATNETTLLKEYLKKLDARTQESMASQKKPPLKVEEEQVPLKPSKAILENCLQIAEGEAFPVGIKSQFHPEAVCYHPQYSFLQLQGLYFHMIFPRQFI